MSQGAARNRIWRRALLVAVALVLTEASSLSASDELDSYAASSPGANLEEAAQLKAKATELSRQGKYGEAAALVKRSLAIQEEGSEHPDIAVSLNNLAALYRAKGDYAQAKPLYQRALAIREKALGPERSLVARAAHAAMRVQ